MGTTVDSTGVIAPPQSSAQAHSKAAPVDTQVTAPEKVETPQAVPAAGSVQKPSLQPVPNSALTTYKDHDSGRLIVRVFDRESGDVLAEFPPERAFRSATEVLENAKPKTKISI